MSVSWSEFRERSLELAQIGVERLHGRLSYLATLRTDGSPRVAPVSAFTDGAALWLFVGAQSPKRHDLINDGRFAIHCAVEDNHGGEGEFHITGIAKRILDSDARKRAEAVWPGDDPVKASYLLFELLISTVRHTTYSDASPVHKHWDSQAPS